MVNAQNHSAESNTCTDWEKLSHFYAAIDPEFEPEGRSGSSAIYLPTLFSESGVFSAPLAKWRQSTDRLENFSLSLVSI